MFDMADTNDDGIITFNEFIELMKSFPEIQHKYDPHAPLFN